MAERTFKSIEQVRRAYYPKAAAQMKAPRRVVVVIPRPGVRSDG